MPTDEKDIAQSRLKLLDYKLGIYRHYKGGLYVVFAVSLLETSLTPMVHYYSLKKGTRWTRTASDFFGFVYPEGKPKEPRFSYIRLAISAERKKAVES
jgi:hypothetical protein